MNDTLILVVACGLALVALGFVALRKVEENEEAPHVNFDELTEKYGAVIERHGRNELRLKCVCGVEAWRLVDEYGTVLLVTYGHRPAGSEISFSAYAAEVGIEKACEESG